MPYCKPNLFLFRPVPIYCSYFIPFPCRSIPIPCYSHFLFHFILSHFIISFHLFHPISFHYPISPIPFHTISFHSPIPSRSHSTPPSTPADHDRNTHNALPPIPPHRRNGTNPRLSRALTPASSPQPPRRTYAQPAPMHLQRLHVRSRDQAGPVLRGVLGGHIVR